MLLVAVTAAAPVSLQIFLPALPALHKDLGVSTGTAQLALSLSVFANAVATLLYGPLSDRYGRRPVLIAGLALFASGSAVAIVAAGIWTLIGARVLQAAGAAAGMVLARAMVRDLYERESAAKAIAYLTMAMVVAPMLAPAFGAVLTDAWGWRAVFVATTVLALLLLAATLNALPETRAGSGESGGWAAMLAGAGYLMRRPLFLAYTLQSSFAIGTFFAFLGGAPYFVIDVLGRSATDYGLSFMLVPASFMAGNLVSARSVARTGLHRLIAAGSGLSLVAVGAGLGGALAGHWTLATLFGAMALAAFGNGLSIANAMAGAVSIEPRLAGTASGLVGFCQMSVAAAVSQAVGASLDATPYPLLGFMLACAGLSALGYGLGQRIAERETAPRHT